MGSGRLTLGRGRLFGAAVMLLLLVASAPLSAGGRPSAAGPTGAGSPADANSVRAHPAFDVRRGRVEAPPERRRAAESLRASLGRFGRVDLDRRTGTPRIVAKVDGYLTTPNGAAPETIALNYVLAHADLFGLGTAEVGALELMRSTRTADYTHLVFAQSVGGIPALDNGIVANVAADGRLINIGGSPLPGLSVDSLEPTLGAADAVRLALADAGASVGVNELRREAGPRQPTTFEGGHSAKLTLFGEQALTRLAWRVTLRLPSGEGVDALVDASTGAPLRRQSLTHDAVTARVFPHFPGAPVGGSQVTVDISPYVAFPGANELFGDFAYVFTDVNDDGFPYPLSEEIRPSSGDDYLYTFSPFNVPSGNCAPFPCSWDHQTASSWTTNRRQAGTQAFYFVNRFHDHLLAAPIEFTAAKGNFEVVERVWVDVDNGASLNGGLPDASHRNNSFMSTFPPGGEPGAYMSLLLFQPTAGETFRTANSADDPSLVYHEYTHGLSSRLVSDADWVALLDQHQAISMAEGWSDWYALDFIVQEGLLADTATGGEVKVGLYLGNSHRTQGLDCAVGAPPAQCPGSAGAGSGGYTYGDIGKVIDYPESHADGEVWAETLWDLRRRLIVDRGAVEGVRRTQLLVTRGMELAPGEPSFLDARNAILQADTVFNAGADRSAIWQVFAARGMGYFAGTIDAADARPAESFAVPPPPGAPTGTIAGTVTSDQGVPLIGAEVSVGGHDSGFGGDLTATTDATGHYAIGSVPAGTYEQVFAVADGGYSVALATDVVVIGGQTTTRNFTVIRDWAASAGGAAIAAFTGPDYGPGCGPPLAIDGVGRGTWVTDSPARPDSPGPKSITVQLPAAVDISSFAIDPTTGCHEGITSSLGDFKIETSTDGASYVLSATGTFTRADTYRVNTVLPNAGTTMDVRFVRLTGMTTQDMNPPFAGSEWMGVTELEVYGSTGGAGGACSRTGSAVSLALSSGGSYTVGRSGSNLSVTGPGVTDSTCGGATMTNIDSISATGAGGNETLTLDFAGGPLGPGLSAEGTGTSEIEVSVNLGTGSDSLRVTGSSAADKYRFGTTGANLNADDDGDDVVLVGVESLTVEGGAGADTVSAEGGLATGSALGLAVVLNGGAGNDKQTGGTGNDVVSGGDGKDTCNALKIPDGIDVCNGGVGTDTASYSNRTGAVTLTNNGVANDGSAGEGDNVAGDVENLTAGKGGDTITIVSLGANTGKGGSGNDTVDVRDGVASNGDKADGGGGAGDSCLTDTGDTKVNCEI